MGFGILAKFGIGQSIGLDYTSNERGCGSSERGVSVSSAGTQALLWIGCYWALGRASES